MHWHFMVVNIAIYYFWRQGKSPPILYFPFDRKNDQEISCSTRHSEVRRKRKEKKKAKKQAKKEKKKAKKKKKEVKKKDKKKKNKSKKKEGSVLYPATEAPILLKHIFFP